MSKERARELRWNMTDAERRLAALLRRKKLSGFRFRRQAQIGPYYADFFCPAARLIIEVDGAFHGNVEHAPQDETRTHNLAQRGCRVIRFWNTHVYAQSSNVPLPPLWGKLDGKLREKRSAASLKGGTVQSAPLPSRLRRDTFPHTGGRGTRE